MKAKSAKPYWEKLRDPRWQKRSAEIKERDGWKCSHCGDKENMLAVHHKFYRRGAEPWEYEDCELITLCDNCHKGLEEDLKKIHVFMSDSLWNRERIAQYADLLETPGTTLDPIIAPLSMFCLEASSFVSDALRFSASEERNTELMKNLRGAFTNAVKEASVALHGVEAKQMAIILKS